MIMPYKDPKSPEARASAVRRATKYRNTAKGRATDRRASARYQKAHPEYTRKRWLKYAYKISPEEYEKLLAQQKGLCALCRRPPKPGQRLVVDHDHKKKFVRGLLHPNCNLALGLLQDDPGLFQAGASYLQDAQLRFKELNEDGPEQPPFIQ